MDLRAKLISDFICIADKCEDTCCKHWSMQVDLKTFELYKKAAPELVEAVESDNTGGYIMKKDTQTGYCVKFENGKCGIQNKYGDSFLGDACYSYPRITRVLGRANIVTATMSCPEVARLALYGNDPFKIEQNDIVRVPQDRKNILPESILLDDAIAIHSLFIDITKNESISAEQIFARIASISRSLQRVEKKDWVRAAPLYLRLVDGVLPSPEKNINDPFNLLHSLCGLVVASNKNISPRLKQAIDDMEKALCVELDWKNILIKADEKSLAAYYGIKNRWENGGKSVYDSVLKKWLGAQLSASFYPFAGLGDDLIGKVTIIGVRFAILKLALASAYSIYGGKLHQDDVVRITQSLSRFLEHLADPAFSLRIYAETGWDRENRMLGLLC